MKNTRELNEIKAFIAKVEARLGVGDEWLYKAIQYLKELVSEEEDRYEL